MEQGWPGRDVEEPAMTSWKRLAVAGVVAAGLPAAMLLVGVWACGPDWEPEVFVPEHYPANASQFADGHLGVLQRGYYHAPLIVAYRYLHGGKLSDAEKVAGYNPPAPPRRLQTRRTWCRRGKTPRRLRSPTTAGSWRDRLWMERRESGMCRKRGLSSAGKPITPSKTSN